VRQSGGHIFVYSEPAHGTTIKIYFPCVSEAAPAAVSVPAAVGLPEGHEKVFLVEDVQEVRDFVKLVLESCGYQVHEAASGQTALEQYRENDRCQLLISDVIMPGMSGPRLAEALQERDPELKVLYISGYTDDAVLRYGILSSGIPFLAKPFTPSQLAQKVREVLDA
ncbi:MAG: response regulator, partial [Candidatus Sericytochromatia bacterium]